MFKKIVLALAVGVAGLALASPAEAHPARPYYRTHGVRFAGGYYYRGFDHHHWGHRVWSPVYRRYQYWDPYLRVYFYWAPDRGCYYPVGYTY
jgi:hypothetical protein